MFVAMLEFSAREVNFKFNLGQDTCFWSFLILFLIAILYLSSKIARPYSKRSSKKRSSAKLHPFKNPVSKIMPSSRNWTNYLCEKMRRDPAFLRVLLKEIRAARLPSDEVIGRSLLRKYTKI